MFLQQSMIGHPPDKVFKQIVSDGTLTNCPVVPNDVSKATAIFGSNLSRMQGASTRKKTNKKNVEFTKIPREFYLQHKVVTLTADVIFVNGIAFDLFLAKYQTAYC